MSRNLLLACLLLSACAAPPLQRLALQLPASAQVQTLDSRPFPLLAATARAPTTAPTLRIYIEGDGHAWISPSQPSLDPTPRDPWFAKLALDDPQPSAWLARPCQYVRNPRCQVRDWTNGRFSQEVLDSLSQALDLLKRQHASEHLELIGYSGGAALALLLAARRDDVLAVQSLAGNLSPRLWAAQQRLSPLHGSLEPLDYKQRLQSLPQRHLSGSEDNVVPANLTQQWRQHLGQPACTEIILLPGVDHHQGWSTAWRYWRYQPVVCNP